MKRRNININSKRILVVGLGFGRMYADELTFAGAGVHTLDADADTHPTFKHFNEIPDRTIYDMVIIATPNHTHEELITFFSGNQTKEGSIILVEKPGVKSSDHWMNMVVAYPELRIVMTKNNMYRQEMRHLRQIFVDRFNEITSVDISWINHNRIPHPGTWFTEKEKAFGGVSKDLMSHLLTLMISLVGNDIAMLQRNRFNIAQNYDLNSVSSTDYGHVDPSGIYDVDDFCNAGFVYYLGRQKMNFNLRAEWKSPTEDKTAITFNFRDDTDISYNFGLCPNHVYMEMMNQLFIMSEEDYKFHNAVDSRVHEWTEA